MRGTIGPEHSKNTIVEITKVMITQYVICELQKIKDKHYEKLRVTREIRIIAAAFTLKTMKEKR